MLKQQIRKKFNFFKSLTEQEVDDFLSYCEVKSFNPNLCIWREGDEDNYAAFVLSGKLAIKKKTEFENKHMIVGIFSAGSVVGELCLLTDNHRSASAETLEPTELIILTSKHFERLIEHHPLMGLKLLKAFFVTTSMRLRRSYERIASVF